VHSQPVRQKNETVKTTITNLTNLKQTGRQMRRLAYQYRNDMALYRNYSLPDVFNILKNLPYIKEPPDLEIVKRPKYTLAKGGDCDCKAVCLMAYCHLKGIKFKIIALGQEKMLHHVALLLYISGNGNGRGVWIFADPTYKVNQLGRSNHIYQKHLFL
jgi:hypothetical protein